MQKTSRKSKSPSLLYPWMWIFLAALLMAWSVSEWLATPQLAGQLWPADINAQIVAWLGGTAQPDAIGRPEVQLGLLSVWFRLVAVSALLLGAPCLARRSRHAQELPVILRQVAVVWSISSLWWPVYSAAQVIESASLLSILATLLPMWCMSTLAVTLALVWQTWSLMPDTDPSAISATGSAAPVRAKLPVGVLLIAIAAATAVSYWMNYQLYQGLLIPHGDSAMYEEHLWNVWHGKGFRSYLDQGLFLGEHIQVIHLLLLPLHMIWPSHLLLELAESVALAGCAIPIYRIARRYSNDQWAAAFLGIAWLFYYPMHYLDIAIDQKSFRPICLGLPFLFWMIDLAERRKLIAASVCLLLTLSAKEDFALITFPVAVVLAITLRKDHLDTEDSLRSQSNAFRWAVAAAAFSIVYLLLTVLVIIPAFRSGDVVHYSRYFGDLGNSPSDLIKTALTEPGRVLSQLLSARTLIYMAVFTVPLALLPLRRPLKLAGGLLTFTMLALLQFDTGGNESLPPVPFHHFHAPLLPVLFWACAAALNSCKADHRDSSAVRFGLRRYLPRFATARSKAQVILLCCVCTSITGSLTPAGASFWSAESHFGWRSLYRPGKRAAMALIALSQIPQDARVASTDYIHTRLTHCERSYDYSQYRRAVNDYQQGVPEDTDFIVIDTSHHYSWIHRPEDVPELTSAPDQWKLLPDQTDGYFIILQRQR